MSSDDPNPDPDSDPDPDPWPAVPDDRLASGGWTPVEERAETLFTTPAATVRGHTRLYEDATLRAAVREATGVDRIQRFFFATRLSFAPPLPPGGASLVKPIVVSRSRRRFTDQLRERGFEDVTVDRTRSIRVASGGRARLTRYRARAPLPAPPAAERATGGGAGDGSVDVDAVGLLAAWTSDDGFRLAGGAYPHRGLERVGVDAGGGDSGGYHGDLLSLIRAVE